MTTDEKIEQLTAIVQRYRAEHALDRSARTGIPVVDCPCANCRDARRVQGESVKCKGPRGGAIAKTHANAQNEKHIVDELVEMAETAPDEEVDKLPHDMARNVDHYLYGSSKKDAAGCIARWLASVAGKWCQKKDKT